MHPGCVQKKLARKGKENLRSKFSFKIGGVVFAPTHTGGSSLSSNTKKNMKTKKLTTPILIISALISGLTISIFASTGCKVAGEDAVATGYHTEANGDYSTAMGAYTKVSGHSSTAMGYATIASGHSSTAMGYGTIASGYQSMTVGTYASASGWGSTAMGHHTIASGDQQLVIGKYNIEDSGSGNDNAAFILGNGTGMRDEQRSNAFKITWNGKTYNNGNFPISDIRLKTNIQTITNPLEKIMKLRGVRYEWKKEEKRTHGYKPEIGLIAQEVEKIVPELVSTDKTPDAKGRYLKSVAYEKTVGLLIEGIKEQQKEIEELRVENKNLLKRIEKLENKQKH